MTEVAPEPETPDEEAQAEPSYAGRGFVFLVLLVGGAALLSYRVYPHHHPLGTRHNFIDVIFANNLVVFAARLVLLSSAGVLAVAAVFIVISFWKRGKAGHWMSRFGPFETQAVENLGEIVAQWQQWWQEEYARRTELEERVEQSDQLLGELNARYEAALLEIGRLGGNHDDDVS